MHNLLLDIKENTEVIMQLRSRVHHSVVSDLWIKWMTMCQSFFLFFTEPFPLDSKLTPTISKKYIVIVLCISNQIQRKIPFVTGKESIEFIESMNTSGTFFKVSKEHQSKMSIFLRYFS